jgi:hypothetical protein
MPLTDRVAWPVAIRLLTCLDSAIELLASPPKNIGLRPGDSVAFYASRMRDECCEGLAWVRVVSVAPSSTNQWPNPDILPQKCNTLRYAVVLEMGIVRCAPAPGANEIPSQDAWDTLTETILDDMAAMQKAVCCFADGFNGLYLEGTWTPLSIEGACAGGSMNLTVSAGACNCKKESESS